MAHHDALWLVCTKLEEDYAPYGKAEREHSDCSCGCQWYYPLEDRDGQDLSSDWGVCSNPISHRCGLLTFEHQGCRYFEADLSDEEAD